MRPASNLNRPEDIRPDEVVIYWEQLDEKTPHNIYRVYRSPNRALIAWVHPETGAVALMWSRITGQEYQKNEAALYPFISKLGGWI